MIDLIWNREIDPKVFDLTLPLEEVAEGYRAMDERRAIKALLLPGAATSNRTAFESSSRDRHRRGGINMRYPEGFL